MTMRRLFFILCSIATAGAAAACDGGEAREDAWQSEARGAAYAFVLRSDAGVREGPNAFDLEIQPIDGSELDAGATVSVLVRMRAMTHADQTAEVTRLDASSFALEDVVFPMPGTWDLEVSVEDGAAIDRATFELDVP